MNNKEIIEYIITHYTLFDLFMVIALLILFVRTIERFLKWIFSLKDFLFKKLGIETKKMREKREWKERLEKAEKDIEEIKNTSKHNVNMFLDHERQVVEKFTGIKEEIVSELSKLHEQMEKTNEINKKTDCAMLRDRIAAGMRYFSRNKGPEGKVHISMSDYENMEALFQEYFSKNGNGAFKKMYKTEFETFIIDR